MTNTTFDGLGLIEPLRLALKIERHVQPTPIQARAIPLIAEGKDLLGIAETGSGKTAAFALPILQRLSLKSLPRNPGAPHALILAPTRELASQIGERISGYGRGLSLRAAVIFGGVNQHHQVKALKAGVDILVATPGRLLDLCHQRHIRLLRHEGLSRLYWLRELRGLDKGIAEEWDKHMEVFEQELEEFKRHFD